jgi:glucans biosynthesis protein
VTEATEEAGAGRAEASGGEAAPRCGARLRTAGTCPLPPAAGKRRCFQHGGARGAHAPAGNRNNWRDGFYSREMKAERRRINGFIRQCLQTLREFDGK